MSESGNTSLLTLEEVAERCGVRHTYVQLLQEHGVIEVQQSRPMLLPQEATLRVNKVVRLERDLGVNLAGASLVLELLERIEELERQLQARRRTW